MGLVFKNRPQRYKNLIEKPNIFPIICRFYHQFAIYYHSHDIYHNDQISDNQIIHKGNGSMAEIFIKKFNRSFINTYSEEYTSLWTTNS